MNNQRSFIRVLILWAIGVTLIQLIGPRYFPQFFVPQRPPSPVEISQKAQTLRDKAARAEQEALTSGARLSLSERSQKWTDAIKDYQRIEGLSGHSDAAIDAKFQEARLYEERAASDASDTSDYDQAERIFKDLARQYPRRVATITIDGRPTSVVVGRLAQQKLDADLYARDQRLRHHLLYKVLDFFVAATGRVPGFSYWFALFLLTLILKAALFPVTKKQFKSMADMQRIAPKMKEVQEKLKGRPADEINRKIMALYKEEGVSPAAGCVPMLAQMPVLWTLYAMIRMYEYQFRHGSFLWIGSALSHQYPQFLGTSLAVVDIPLLLVYAVSMFLTSRLQPAAGDPQQVQQQKMMAYAMPVMFTWWSWSARWPSAFTLYWLVMNVISTAQQWHILRTVHGSVPSNPPQASLPGSGGQRPPNPPNGSGPVNGNGRGPRPVKPGQLRSGGGKKSGRR